MHQKVNYKNPKSSAIKKKVKKEQKLSYIDEDVESLKNITLSFKDSLSSAKSSRSSILQKRAKISKEKEATPKRTKRESLRKSKTSKVSKRNGVTSLKPDPKQEPMSPNVRKTRSDVEKIVKAMTAVPVLKQENITSKRARGRETSLSLSRPNNKKAKRSTTTTIAPTELSSQINQQKQKGKTAHDAAAKVGGKIGVKGSKDEEMLKKKTESKVKAKAKAKAVIEELIHLQKKYDLLGLHDAVDEITQEYTYEQQQHPPNPKTIESIISSTSTKQESEQGNDTLMYDAMQMMKKIMNQQQKQQQQPQPSLGTVIMSATDASLDETKLQNLYEKTELETSSSIMNQCQHHHQSRLLYNLDESHSGEEEENYTTTLSDVEELNDLPMLPSSHQIGDNMMLNNCMIPNASTRGSVAKEKILPLGNWNHLSATFEQTRLGGNPSQLGIEEQKKKTKKPMMNLNMIREEDDDVISSISSRSALENQLDAASSTTNHEHAELYMEMQRLTDRILSTSEQHKRRKSMGVYQRYIKSFEKTMDSFITEKCNTARHFSPLNEVFSSAGTIGQYHDMSRKRKAVISNLVSKTDAVMESNAKWTNNKFLSAQMKKTLSKYRAKSNEKMKNARSHVNLIHSKRLTQLKERLASLEKQYSCDDLMAMQNMITTHL